MDADLLRAVLALACLAVAVYALAAVARRRFTDTTAILVVLAAVVWGALTDTTKVGLTAGAVLAFAFLLLDAAAEQAEAEAMQS